MKPENVNPSNFKVENIIFDNKDFSIAYGTWEDGNETLAMRWNGKDNDPGYPKVFGHPMWFVVHNQLHLPLIKSLLGEIHTNKEEIQKVIDKLI